MSFIIWSMVTEMIENKVILRMNSEVKISEFKTGFQVDKD